MEAKALDGGEGIMLIEGLKSCGMISRQSWVRNVGHSSLSTIGKQRTSGVVLIYPQQQ